MPGRRAAAKKITKTFKLSPELESWCYQRMDHLGIESFSRFVQDLLKAELRRAQAGEPSILSELYLTATHSTPEASAPSPESSTQARPREVRLKTQGRKARTNAKKKKGKQAP